jgi:hypothetical protein
MEIENENNQNIINNEIYQKLENNNLISYPLSTNNNINKEFELNEKEKECFTIIMNILKKNNLF